MEDDSLSNLPTCFSSGRKHSNNTLLSCAITDEPSSSCYETSKSLLVSPQSINLILRFTPQDIVDIISRKNTSTDTSKRIGDDELEPRLSNPSPFDFDDDSISMTHHSLKKNSASYNGFVAQLYLVNDDTPEYLCGDEQKQPLCVLTSHLVQDRAEFCAVVRTYKSSDNLSINENDRKQHYQHFIKRHFDRRMSVFESWKAILSCFTNIVVSIDMEDDFHANVCCEAIIPSIGFKLFNAKIVSNSSFMKGSRLGENLDAGVLVKSISGDIQCEDINACRGFNQIVGIWICLNTTCTQDSLVEHPLVYALCSFYKRTILSFHDIVPFHLVVGRLNAPTIYYDVIETFLELPLWSVLDYETVIDLNSNESNKNIFAKLRNAVDGRKSQVIHNLETIETEENKTAHTSNDVTAKQDLSAEYGFNGRYPLPATSSSKANDIISNQQLQIIGLQNKVEQLSKQLLELSQNQHCFHESRDDSINQDTTSISSERIDYSTSSDIHFSPKMDDCNLSTLTNPTLGSPITRSQTKAADARLSEKTSVRNRNENTSQRKVFKQRVAESVSRLGKSTRYKLSGDDSSFTESSNDDEGLTMVHLEAKYLGR